MRHLAFVLLGALVGGAAVLGQAPQMPVFLGGTRPISDDVSAADRDGRVVPGLSDSVQTRGVFPDVSERVLSDPKAAETEGATYPTGDASHEQAGRGAADIEDTRYGTHERRCVDADDLERRGVWVIPPQSMASPMLSGDFLTGPIYPFLTSWQQGYTKVWWTPRYLEVPWPEDWGNAGLVVRETRLDPPGLHTTYRYGHMVSSAPEHTGLFNSDFWAPTAGRWMFVATFGQNWGCFLMTLR